MTWRKFKIRYSSNDAVSFLRGEVFAGIAQNCKTVLGFTLGTGFDSSIYKRGEATDANLLCSPFKDGIAEDYFSTRWFVKRFEEKTSKRVKGVKDLAALYNDEAVVREIFNEFGVKLADFFLSISELEKPEMIVVGGNIARSFSFCKPFLKRRLTEKGANMVIEKSILNETATLFGSATCCLQKEMVIKCSLIMQQPDPCFYRGPFCYFNLYR